MSLEAAERIAKAVLYEGYLLYPYHPSSTKNRQRWTFGGLYPSSYVEAYPGSDLSEMRTECLIEGSGDACLDVELRFLHLISRRPEHSGAAVGGWDAWEEACERDVALRDLRLCELARHPHREVFAFAPMNRVAGGFVRTQAPVESGLEVRAQEIDRGLYRMTVRVCNTSKHRPADRSEALLHSLISSHTILSARGAGFVSAIDPPEAYREAAASCRNEGAWPVLIGKPGERATMLSSPIILYDHPQIAPESPGDLFDGAEIDEILSLRILTLTDEEKAQVRAGDERARRLLERTEALSGDDLMRLHGRLREIEATGFRVGDRVRILPVKRSDAFDVVLAGMVARVESIEHDLEGNSHLSVTLEDDPGRELGVMGQPGHRFFFRADEVEPL